MQGMGLVGTVVVLCDFAFYGGGASKVALDSAMALSEHGIDVYLFSAVGPVEPRLAATPTHVVCLRQRDILSDTNRVRALVNGLWNGQAKHELSKLLARLRPQETVVHAHQWAKALSPSVLQAVYDAGFPLVATFHDYFATCPNGGFIVYPRNEICERVPLSINCIACNCDARNYAHKIWRVARQLVQNKVVNFPKKLRHAIYVSEFSRRVLAPHLPQHIHWHYVPNPADFERDNRVDIAKNRSFVFVGQLAKHKGPTLFAAAARRAGVEAIFVGEGEERAAILQANPDAVLTGWVDRSEVATRLKQARALVFPSLWYECQPLAVMEALALGVPAVVSNRCAASDSVVDGCTGFHFERGSLDDLVEKLNCLKDDQLAETLSKRAYEGFWRTTFTLSDHVSMLRAVYARALADTGCVPDQVRRA